MLLGHPPDKLALFAVLPASERFLKSLDAAIVKVLSDKKGNYSQWKACQHEAQTLFSAPAPIACRYCLQLGQAKCCQGYGRCEAAQFW